MAPVQPLAALAILAAMASSGAGMTKEEAMKCVALSTEDARKAPCVIAKDELSFALIGDWGGKATAEGDENLEVYSDYKTLLQSLHAKKKFDFILNVGDTFYPYWTPKAPAKEEFKKTWERIDPGDKVVLPFFGMFGNHDYINIYGIQQQIEQTAPAKADKRWILPDRYYSINMHLKTSTTNRKVKFIMLDTQLLCGVIFAGGGLFRGHGREQMHPHRLDQSIKQEIWMIRELEQAYDYEYVYLVGHYPIANVVTEFPEIPCMVEVIPEQLLHDMKVTAYLSGHEHLLQHLISKKHNVHYILSGEGYDIHQLKPGSVEKYKEYATSFFHGRLKGRTAPGHFKDVRANKPGMIIAKITTAKTQFDYVDKPDGSDILHTVSLAPRPTSNAPPAARSAPQAPLEGDHSIAQRSLKTGAAECVKQWSAKLEKNEKDWAANSKKYAAAKVTVSKDPIIFKHAHFGEIGCLEDLELPIDKPAKESIGLTEGANRVKLLGLPSKKPAMPVWECWKCTAFQEAPKKEGDEPPPATFSIRHAFCHLQPDRLKNWVEETSWYGLLPYNRYVHLDGYRYSCTGIPVEANNEPQYGIMKTVPLYTKDAKDSFGKPLVKVPDDKIEAWDGEFAGMQVREKKEEYIMSEDTYFLMQPCKKHGEACPNHGMEI